MTLAIWPVAVVILMLRFWQSTSSSFSASAPSSSSSSLLYFFLIKSFFSTFTGHSSPSLLLSASIYLSQFILCDHTRANVSATLFCLFHVFPFRLIATDVCRIACFVCCSSRFIVFVLVFFRSYARIALRLMFLGCHHLYCVFVAVWYGLAFQLWIISIIYLSRRLLLLLHRSHLQFLRWFYFCSSGAARPSFTSNVLDSYLFVTRWNTLYLFSLTDIRCDYNDFAQSMRWRWCYSVHPLTITTTTTVHSIHSPPLT